MNLEVSEERRYGKVVHFVNEKGFGFIRSDDTTLDDVYFRHVEIEPQRKGFKTILVGDSVSFVIKPFTMDDGAITYRAYDVQIVR